MRFLPSAVAAVLMNATIAVSITVTLHAWPLSSPSPVPFAELHLNDNQELPSGTILSYTPPKIKHPDELVRIGVYDGPLDSWRGSATSSNFFGDKVDRQIAIYIDESGVPYHIGAASADVPDPAKQPKTKKKKGDKKEKVDKAKKLEWRNGETTIEVVRSTAAPFPTLNKPIVVSEEGLPPMPLAQEKSFLQKYWWAIALFLLLNVIMGFAPEESSSGSGSGNAS